MQKKGKARQGEGQEEGKNTRFEILQYLRITYRTHLMKFPPKEF